MKEVNIENGRMVTIDIVKANIFAVVLMIVSGIALLVPYILIWHDQWSRETVKEFFDTFLWRGSLFVILMAVGIVVHELIHGITFACFAPSGWRSISFGIMWKMATPYCHCNEPLHPRPYIVAALMPLIVLGIIPAVICLVIGSFYLLLWSISSLPAFTLVTPLASSRPRTSPTHRWRPSRTTPGRSPRKCTSWAS